jgi:hypothetical protein
MDKSPVKDQPDKVLTLEDNIDNLVDDKDRQAISPSTEKKADLPLKKGFIFQTKKKPKKADES